jgi:RNA polymerase sigma factor (sigma-70 family)
MTTTTATVISHLQHWLMRAGPNPATDAILVRRFVQERDESAFAALVDRHGPMVLGVARRIVGDHHTAEDVFQATFLVLARRAGHLRHPAALPAWLHHTAHNLAVTARRARQRRNRAEAEALSRATSDPLEDLSSRELLAILDEELRRLPETFRLPLILCCLEGRSQDEAASVLGWTPGSVKGRLERGRQRLKDRLAQRGLTFAIAAGVSLLVVRPALAAGLRQAALEAVRAGGSVSPTVAELANGATKPLFTAGWKTILVAATIGLVGVGVGLASFCRSPEQTAEAAAAEDQPATPPADRAADPLPEGAVARLGSSPLRIGNSAFALTPDGKTIVTVSPEGIVRHFDANTGRLLERRQLTDRTDVHPSGQWHAQLAADGKTVALDEPSGLGRRVTVRDVLSGKVLFRRTPEEGKSFGAYALAPDGKQLALNELVDGPRRTWALHVYDLETKQAKELGSLEYNVDDVRFTTDGKRVFVSQGGSQSDWAYACFDVRAGKQLWKLPRKGMEFAITPDGKKLVSAAYSGGEAPYQVIETDPDSGKPTESYVPGIEPHPNIRLVIAPDNRTVVMNHFFAIIMWDLQTGTEIRRFNPLRGNGHGYGPELGAMSSDGRTLITNLGVLQRWDLTTGKPMFDVPPDDGLATPIERLAFTADGKELFASSWGLTSGRWDVTTGKQVGFARDPFGQQVVSTPAGLRALHVDASNSPHEVTLIDPIAGKPLQTVRWAEKAEVGRNGFGACTLTANGKTLLIAHGDKQNFAVTACDVASGRRLSRFTVPGKYYYPRCPFSPCGRWVVLGGKVYHVATGTELFTPAGEPGERLVPGEWAWPITKGPVWFSEDGRLMAGQLLRKAEKEPATTDALAVWELASGKVLARFPKAEFVGQVAFGPNNRTIALLDGHGIRLHDLLTGEPLADYAAPDVTCEANHRGHDGPQTVVFAPDGRTLATGHRDGAILLWKVPQPAADGPKVLTEADRASLWADLASDSPATGRRAVERLLHDPAAVTAKFPVVPTPADPALTALVKDLDSDMFATREEASRKLREYGTKAERALRRELAAGPSPEMKRRLEGILEAIGPPVLRLPLTGDTLRGVRAIEVLERAGTPEARALLQAWAEQGRDERLAAEARIAVER